MNEEKANERMNDEDSLIRRNYKTCQKEGKHGKMDGWLNAFAALKSKTIVKGG